jgi:hypothetical protein
MQSNPNNFIPENLEKSETAAREESILQFWKDNQIFDKTLAKESPMQATLSFSKDHQPQTAALEFTMSVRDHSKILFRVTKQCVGLM